jgi:outer membrane lipoprotein-sorting protein
MLIKSMPRRLTQLFLHAILLWGAALTAQADPTAQQLAERLDFVRRPTQSFGVNLTITELKNGKPEQVSVLHVMARKHPESTRFDAVALCLDPVADRGKCVFTGDKEVWFFDPKAKHPTQVSAHHFKGKFFVSDALSTSFIADYEVELDGEETIPDAAHHDVPCFRLKMKRREKGGLTPDTIEYWIDKKLMQPIRGEFFTASGKLLRTSYYAGYAKVFGETRPTRVLVVSNTERGVVTDIKFSDFLTREWPPAMFSKDALEMVSRGELP